MDIQSVTICQGGRGLGERLGKRLPVCPATATGKYFVVVHPDPDPDKGSKHSLETELPRWGSDSHCQGVLYVRGSTHGGVNDAKLRKAAQDLYAHRASNRHTPRHWVHFLSYAVYNNGIPSSELLKRFAAFFGQIESHGQVDWTLIDGGWPDHLVAAYVLALALKQEGEVVGAHLMECHEIWTPIWEEARREYRAYKEEELMPESLNAQSAGILAMRVGACLTVADPRRPR